MRLLLMRVNDQGEVREVQHDIVTGDSPPIRQQVRRVPFALRDKVTGMVHDMLRDGVVSLVVRGLVQWCW